MNQEKEEEEVSKGKYVNLEAAPLFPSGLGVAATPDMVILTFYFVPPEDDSTKNILARVALVPSAAEYLAKSLNEALKEQESHRS